MNSGDPASLTCSVYKGDLPIDIMWLHNNKTVTNIDGLSVLRSRKVSTLTIDSAQAEHAGEYTCVGKNLAGSASFTAYLHVNGIL